MRQVSTQWPEPLILKLGTAFVTRGIHNVPVNSYQQGRVLLYYFLSFHHYASFAYVSFIKHNNHTTTLVNLADIVRDYNQEDLEAYLLNSFYYELLWIELSPSLLRTSWYPVFMQKIADFNLPARMPIIVFTL